MADLQMLLGDQSDPSDLQDVFKESRSQDHTEAKTDAETQFRSRKLPLTRKIYAFYRAPIVKFWSNTVGPSQSRRLVHAAVHPAGLSEQRAKQALAGLLVPSGCWPVWRSV